MRIYKLHTLKFLCVRFRLEWHWYDSNNNISSINSSKLIESQLITNERDRNDFAIKELTKQFAQQQQTIEELQRKIKHSMLDFNNKENETSLFIKKDWFLCIMRYSDLKKKIN